MNNLFKKSVSMVALLSMLAPVATPAFAAVSIADGDLVKASGSSALYLVNGTTLRTFPYSTIYHSWGYPSNYSTVKTVSASDLAGYTVGDPVPFRDGTCFRGTAKSLPGFASQAVFCVSDGQLRPVESQNAFFGLFNVANWTQGNKYVQYIPDDFLSKFDYAFGSVVKESDVNAGTLMDGLVVKGSVDGSYYLVQDGKLRAISAAAAAANKIDLSTAIVTAQTKINAIPSALPVSSTVETSLVTPKTKAQAEQGGTTTDVTQATKLVVSADQTSVQADGATQVTISARVATDAGATVSTATNNVSFAITSGSGTLSSVSAAAVNGVATVKLTPSTVASTIVVSASATGLTAGTVSIVTTANTLAPSVVSVANSGMRIINVAFDKALDKNSAETPTNYTVKNNQSSTITVNNAKLLNDGKTVQLYLAIGMYNDTIADSVEVKNIQNAAQSATVSDTTTQFTMTDSSVPTVVAVEALGSRAMRVTFSEAVLANDFAASQSSVTGVGVFSGMLFNTDASANYTDNGTSTNAYNAFRLDDKLLLPGSDINASSYVNGVTVTYPDAGDYTKALISFASPITVGAHTLTVSYNGLIKDYNVTTDGSANANVMQPAGYVATVAADTTVPQLSSVEALTQTKVRYTFSKAVQTPSVNAFYWSTAANQTSGTYASSVTKVSDTVYEVTWGSAVTTGTVYFYAGSTSYGVNDYSGNNISPLPSSQSVAISTDTAPTISSVSMDTNSDRVVIVYFNKDVDEATAESTGNYVFKTSTGTVLTSDVGGNGITSNGNPINSPVRDTTNLKKVTITLGSATQDDYALPGGTYQLAITGVKTSGGTTAMTTGSYTFSVTDRTRPTLKGYTDNHFTNGTNLFAGSHRVILKFSEALDSASATSALNYKYSTDGGATWTKLSDLSGVTVTQRNSNKDVVITFPDTTTLTSTTRLMVGYIDGSTVYSPKDIAGNYLKGDNAGTTVSVADVLGNPVSTTGLSAVLSLKVVGTTLLKATFANEIDTISASDFKVVNAINSNITPTSAEVCTAVSTNCDTVDAKTVIFTIPSGTTTEFTANDGSNVQLWTSGVTNQVLTTKDVLNLPLIANTNLSSLVTVTNNIAPVLKSFAVVDAQHLVLTFDGKIAANATIAGNNTNLAGDLILSQTIGTTTTTWTGTQLTVTDPANSTIVYVQLGSGSLSLVDPVTLRTVSADSIKGVGTNLAKIAANTTGLQNASFVANAITAASLTNLGSTGYGTAFAGSEVFTVTFSKSVDRSSITGTWTDNGNNTYTQTGVSVTFNGSTEKMTINGVGDFQFPGLYVTDGNGISSSSAAATLLLNTNTNVLTVTLTSAPAQTYYTATAGAGNDTVTYIPASGIKTTVGTMINSDYKPVATY